MYPVAQVVQLAPLEQRVQWGLIEEQELQAPPVVEKKPVSQTEHPVPV